jgi:hypothetical protein
MQDLGYVAWRDPWAWMQPMRGERWRRLVTQENAAFEGAMRAVAEKEAVEAALTGFRAAEEAADVESGWDLRRGGVELRVVPKAGGAWQVTGLGGTPLIVGDVDVGAGTLVAYTTEAREGADHFTITVRRGSGGPAWRRRGIFGSEVAFLGGRLYTLEGTAPLKLSRLVSFDARTGKGYRIHHEEPDASVMLGLIRGTGGALFLLGDNAGRQALRWVRPDGQLERLGADALAFEPLGLGAGRRRPAYLYKTSFGAPWRLEGKEGRPPPAGAGVEAVTENLVVWKEGGLRTVQTWGGRIPLRIFGEVAVHPWPAAAAVDEILVTEPGRAPYKVALGSEAQRRPPPPPYGGPLKSGWARSADGARVRWLVCPPPGGEVQGLLMTVYGSYGSATRLSTARWKPFLERGWAIGFALVRGGGDGGLEWAEAGRRQGKARAIDDFLACVTAARRSLGGIPAARTCIYGRSAGGFVVGGAVAREPRGAVFGAAYCEVPYVDVLVTAGDPGLPLTSYEYLEFGDPRRSIVDFETLLRNGPVTALGSAGAPGVYVLCRTGTADQRVGAYEAAKWIAALRGGGGGAAKLLAVQEKGGHFVGGDRAWIEHAEDFLLLSKKCLD